MGNAPVKQLATGFEWAEGPVGFGDYGCLLFPDIPNDRILCGTRDGLTTFPAPANYTDGHTRDHEGLLVSSEHGRRQVTRKEHNGRITVIADDTRASGCIRTMMWCLQATARPGSPIRITGS